MVESKTLGCSVETEKAPVIVFSGYIAFLHRDGKTQKNTPKKGGVNSETNV